MRSKTTADSFDFVETVDKHAEEQGFVIDWDKIDLPLVETKNGDAGFVIDWDKIDLPLVEKAMTEMGFGIDWDQIDFPFM